MHHTLNIIHTRTLLAMSSKHAVIPIKRDLHPNAKLAVEIRQYLKSGNNDLVKAGKQKGLLIPIGDSGKCKLSPKGEEFMSKWEPKSSV